MRIGKPLLITTTALGLGLGIYEAFLLAPAMGMLLVLVLILFGGGIALDRLDREVGAAGLEADQRLGAGRRHLAILAGLHTGHADAARRSRRRASMGSPPSTEVMPGSDIMCTRPRAPRPPAPWSDA